MKKKRKIGTDRETREREKNRKGERMEMYAYYQQNGSNSLKATKAAL